MDEARLANDMNLGRALVEAQHAILTGRVDHLGALQKLKLSLSSIEWPDDGLAQLAREVVATIDSRASLVSKRYARETAVDGSLRDVFRLFERSAP